MNYFLKFLCLFLIIQFFNKNLFSVDFETAKKNLDNKEYIEAYDNFNKCTSDCLETGNCSEEHFLCMLEIGRMLEKGLAEVNLDEEQRINKAKFWYEYCSDKGSEICAQKISTLKPKTQFIVKNIQEKLFDLGYPIKRDDIPVIKESNGVEIKVLVGKVKDTKSVVQTYSPVSIFDIQFKQPNELSLSIPSEQIAMVYVIEGKLTFKEIDSLATKGQMIYFDQGADSIQIHSLSQQGSYLVLAGNPLNEPVARYGPFVANTDGEVKQAMLDYQSGKMGKL